MRAKMTQDLDDLIAQCDKTMHHTKRRENDFKSILIDTDKQMNKMVLQMVNLASENGNLYLL